MCPRFNRLIILSCFALAGSLLAGSFSRAERIHPRLGTEPNDVNGVILHVDPVSGSLRVTQPDDATRALTAIELRSPDSSFIAECEGLDGLFDVCTPEKLFRLDPAGFSEVAFGNVVPPGTSAEEITQWTVDGALFQGGAIPDAVLYVIPEPHSALLFMIGFLMLAWRQFR